MFWTILSYLLVFIIGGAIGSLLIIYLLRRRIATAVIISDESKEVVDQMVKTQKFLTSMPVKDQRAIQLIQSNQRVLKTLQEDINEKVDNYLNS